MKSPLFDTLCALAGILIGFSVAFEDPIEVKLGGQSSIVYVTSADVVSVDAINELGNVVALKKTDDGKMDFMFSSDLPVQFEIKYSDGRSSKTGWYGVKKPTPKSKYDIAGTELSPTDNPVDHARDNNNRGDWYGYKYDKFSATSKLLGIAKRYSLAPGDEDRELVWKAAGFPSESEEDKALLKLFIEAKLVYPK